MTITSAIGRSPVRRRWALVLAGALCAVMTLGGAVAMAEAEAPRPVPEQPGSQEGVRRLPAAPGDLAAHGSPAVLILSGDGGWGEVERKLSDDFRHKGMAVTGVDSRKAFNRHRELAEVVSFIEGLVAREPRVVIVGYSFGADLLPVIWPHLSQGLRHKTLRVAMIAPTHEGSLLIDPTGRYDGQAMEIFPLKDTIGHAPHRRLVCIYGTEEKRSGYSSCPNPGFDPARRVELPGGHDLDHSASQIVSAIAEEIEDVREPASP